MMVSSWQTELVLADGYRIVSGHCLEDGVPQKIFAYTGKHAPDPVELDFARPIRVEESRVQIPVLIESGSRFRHTNVCEEDLYLLVERFEWAIELDAYTARFCNFIEKRKGTATRAVLEI